MTGANAGDGVQAADSKGTQGGGRVRQAVERCHNILAQFGRLRVRPDRTRRHYLNWVELAACVISVRSGSVR